MINIAELLKDAPKGMKLYSSLFGEVKLDDAGGMIYVTTKYGSSKCFTETGCYYVDNETFSTECLLFPSKYCRTWDGWKASVEPKFKVGTWLWHKTKGVFPMMVEDYDEKEGYLMQYLNSRTYFGCDIIENEYRLWNFGDSKPGDILYDKAYNRIGIFENFGHHPDGGSFNDKTYCYLILYYDVDDKEFYENTCNDMDCYDAIPATREQRDLLFAKMEEAGYEWDADKKELKKNPKHYDINNFKPKQWVLVRNSDNQVWGLSMFSHRDMGFYICLNREDFRQCIPFEGNERLLGTTDMCDERFIKW